MSDDKPFFDSEFSKGYYCFYFLSVVNFMLLGIMGLFFFPVSIFPFFTELIFV